MNEYVIEFKRKSGLEFARDYSFLGALKSVKEVSTEENTIHVSLTDKQWRHLVDNKWRYEIDHIYKKPTHSYTDILQASQLQTILKRKVKAVDMILDNNEYDTIASCKITFDDKSYLELGSGGYGYDGESYLTIEFYEVIEY